MFKSPHHRHHIEGTDGLLCLRKTQLMWGKRTGFEAVTTRSSVARTNHRATATTEPDMC